LYLFLKKVILDCDIVFYYLLKTKLMGVRRGRVSWSEEGEGSWSGEVEWEGEWGGGVGRGCLT